MAVRTIACVVVALCGATLPPATALAGSAMRLSGGAPALAPLAQLLFCNAYASQCAPSGEALARSQDETKALLTRVNDEVNARIRPARKTSLGVPIWEIDPQQGDCNDYAVSKRAALIAQGAPASALRLAHVVTARGEDHLVLVARVDDGDYVLDNLNRRVLPVEQAGYRWVKAQLAGSSAWELARLTRETSPQAAPQAAPPLMASRARDQFDFVLRGAVMPDRG
jgi:predicted transglutaminase-like cysteine proteinase